MTSIQIDERDQNIFTRGSWGTQSSNDAVDRTLSFATGVGSTKVVRFRGTSIYVFGRSDTANVTSQYLSIGFSVDGVFRLGGWGDPQTPRMNMPFFQSRTLPMGEHVLTITSSEIDQVTGNWLLDYIIIRADATDSPPQVLLSDGSPTPRDNPLPPNPVSSPSPTATSQQSRFPTSSSITDDTPASSASRTASNTVTGRTHSSQLPSSMSNSDTSFTSLISLNTVLGHQPTMINGNGDVVHPEPHNRNPVVIGATVSTVGFMGGLLSGLLIWVMCKRRRRRRRENAGKLGDTSSVSHVGDDVEVANASMGSDDPPAYTAIAKGVNSAPPVASSVSGSGKRAETTT